MSTQQVTGYDGATANLQAHSQQVSALSMPVVLASDLILPAVNIVSTIPQLNGPGAPSSGGAVGSVGVAGQFSVYTPAPNMPQTSSIGAAIVPGDNLEGGFVYDRRLRVTLERIEEWMRRQFFLTLLLFKAPELSQAEILSAVTTDMASGEDPLDNSLAGDFQQLHSG